MCQICRYPRTKAQYRAKKRILKAERRKLHSKVKKIWSLLDRKMVDVDTDKRTVYGRSNHTGELLPHDWDYHDAFTNQFPYSSIPSSDPISKIPYYYDHERDFIFLSSRYIKIKEEGEVKKIKVLYSRKMIFLNPSEEDMKILKKIGREVSLDEIRKLQ